MTDVSVKNFLKSEGISVINTAVASKIAQLLGVKGVFLSFLVGLPVGFITYAATTNRLSSLQSAIRNSSDGKVRYECYCK